jgi:hypothetical protein
MLAEGKSAASLHFNLELDAGSVSVLSCYPQANQSIATTSKTQFCEALIKQLATGEDGKIPQPCEPPPSRTAGCWLNNCVPPATGKSKCMQRLVQSSLVFDRLTGERFTNQDLQNSEVWQYCRSQIT